MPRGDGTGPMGRGPGTGRGMGGMGRCMGVQPIRHSPPVPPDVNRTALIAVVDAEQCIGCQACENVCQVQAIVIVHGIARIDISKCTGCGRCKTQCPSGAISLRNL